MPFDRGDVVLVLYPDSNLRTAKRRPALVVQADNLQTGLPQVIVTMISSNMSRATDSVIMTDNLATVLEIEIDRRLGRVPDMTAVDNALRNTLAV